MSLNSSLRILISLELRVILKLDKSKLDKPLIKSNYESGRSLGRITSNSIDKIKSKNKTIFDNKKR